MATYLQNRLSGGKALAENERRIQVNQEGVRAEVVRKAIEWMDGNPHASIDDAVVKFGLRKAEWMKVEDHIWNHSR